MRLSQLNLIVFAAVLATQTPVYSGPLVSVGDNVNIFFDGSSTLRYSSNVFRDEDDEVSDVMLVLSPGFEVSVGRGLSNLDLSVITRYDIVRYAEEDQLDTELFFIRAQGSYTSSRLDLSGSVFYKENKTSTGDSQLQDIQDLIEFDDYGARVDGEYRFSPKFSFGAGIDYKEREFNTYEDRFADRETLRLPFDIFYEATPKIDLSAGYIYTTTDVESTRREGVITDGFFIVPGDPNSFVATEVSDITRGSYQFESHFFNIGARGNLLPKLTGFFKVGYRVRDTDDSTTTRVATPLSGSPFTTTSRTSRDDTGMLGLDADLTWAATPKVTARAGLSRDFGVGGEGEATENTSVDLSATYAINGNWSASARLGYTLRDYSDAVREDNQYSAGLRLSYVLNEFWRFGGGYSFVENDSNIDDRSYTNHMFDISASLRY